MPLNGIGLGPRANLPGHSTKLTFPWSSVQYTVCIQLLLYTMKNEEQIEKSFFLKLIIINFAAKKFMQWHNKGFCMCVFVSCKTVFLPSAADHWGCWLNTALKYSQTLSFSYSVKIWKNLSLSHLTCWATQTIACIWMCCWIWMELYSCIISFPGSRSYRSGHQDKDCWLCSFFSFLADGGYQHFQSSHWLPHFQAGHVIHSSHYFHNPWGLWLCGH